MDVAILGASGDCGRAIAGQLVASRLLAPTERLQLVGRADGSSARALYGLISDLTDAHAEYVPDLGVALSPRDVVADLWIVACGRTPPTERGVTDRNELARVNGEIFAAYADALARYGQGNEIVVVVSNPVELGVALFAQAVGRDRVIGIGAYQDTLRFRREIATDLGVRRQRVGGFLVGEHGDAQIPIWSSVAVHGMDKSHLAEAIQKMRKGTESTFFPDLCRDERDALFPLVETGEIVEAYRQLDQLSPDVRVILRPQITHRTGAKTVMATANVAIEVVQTLLDGREVLIAGQVVLEAGDFYGLTGPLGVPIIAGPSGVMRVVEIPLTSGEEAHVRRVSQTVNAKLADWQKALRA